jgi:hypothetical protein
LLESLVDARVYVTSWNEPGRYTPGGTAEQPERVTLSFADDSAFEKAQDAVSAVKKESDMYRDWWCNANDELTKARKELADKNAELEKIKSAITEHVEA